MSCPVVHCFKLHRERVSTTFGCRKSRKTDSQEKTAFSLEPVKLKTGERGSRRARLSSQWDQTVIENLHQFPENSLAEGKLMAVRSRSLVQSSQVLLQRLARQSLGLPITAS
jgi:hypothetical protein